MVMLSDVPATPPDHIIAQLQQAFFSSFEQHVFLPPIIAKSISQGGPPPYLELALACLGATTANFSASPNVTMILEPSQVQVAADLFVSGVSLWSVMLEVDNRESRLCASVTAVRIPEIEGHSIVHDKANSEFSSRQHCLPPSVCSRRIKRGGKECLVSCAIQQLYDLPRSFTFRSEARLIILKICRRTHLTDGYSPVYAFTQPSSKGEGVRR